jgi:hypothetical protein
MDSLALTARRRDSVAIKRILRAVGGNEPAAAP